MQVGRTVLIVDDTAAFRLVARELLESDGFVVIGEASNARAALKAACDRRPDVVLLDVRLPDGSGVDVARIVRGWVDPPVVVLTSTADYTQAARECGAAGFISKRLLSAQTLRAAIEGR